MSKVTFITGNPNKAEVFAKYMGVDVAHKKVDLDEIQSLDLRKITEHKLKQAYELVKAPVLVEDTGCSLDAFGMFPGPFIKWMMEQMSPKDICRLVDGKSRGAVAEICYGYYDGEQMRFFEGSMHGTIPEYPRGNDGFGWNAVFVPDGSTQTYAESGKNFKEDTVYPKLKEFLTNLD